MIIFSYFRQKGTDNQIFKISLYLNNDETYILFINLITYVKLIKSQPLIQIELHFHIIN